MTPINFHFIQQIFQGRFLRQLQFSNTEVKVTSIALLIFAVVFLVVGLYRNVEFKFSPLSHRVKLLCYVLYSIGVINFSFTILLLAADIHQTHQSEVLPFFLSSIIILFPLHIYLALAKRVAKKK